MYDEWEKPFILYYRIKTIIKWQHLKQKHFQRKNKTHPARIAILKVLAQKNECICGEIVEVLPLAQSTVSQHLKELKEAGLIDGSVDGPRSCYCINWKAFEKFNAEFTGLFHKLKDQHTKSCC